jgi:glycosyltransferase involved in cell wall biosynthesis
MIRTDSRRYQVIQVRDMPLLAAIGLLVCRCKGLKFFYWMSYPMPEGHISTAHDRGLSSGLMKFLFPWVSGHIGRLLLYRLVLPMADHIFVQSDQMKIDLIGQGIYSEKMIPVPMGVDVEELHNHHIPVANNIRLTGKRVLVYLGTLVRPRKIEILFEMLAIVNKKFSNVVLVLVGDTNEEIHQQWLEMKAVEAGVKEQLVWTGWLPMLEAWSYVRAADVGLSPFPRGYLLDSASPTKVPEYFALGVPVVCNDNPDQQQIINQSGAGICVPYTAEDFANAVIQILSLDNYKRNEMIMKGKSYVSKYRDYRIIGGDLAHSYKMLLKEG